MVKEIYVIFELKVKNNKLFYPKFQYRINFEQKLGDVWKLNFLAKNQFFEHKRFDHIKSLILVFGSYWIEIAVWS